MTLTVSFFLEIYSSENRIYLPYKSIPAHAIHTFISTEDQHFFSHKGFDINGISAIG
ncbi:transglycosylase domain-containing protein [Anaerobacillus sp. HL2]|nr:transglycosylase domain-containing protein [Anaerobacillus sp. HL2]